MKTLLVTLNAKYIHTSLALRYLYIATKDQHSISYKEYTIRESTETIANNILSHSPDIVGIGVYIWNVKQTEDLLVVLKRKKPNLCIILGGPEVSYEPNYFLHAWEVDYVVCGEGEFVLGELLESIKKGGNQAIPAVSSKSHPSSERATADLQKLAALPSPYQIKEDDGDRQHRVVYFETSRACPFHCSYCLSSLEKPMRSFPETYVLENLGYLIQNGTKTLKFLDRSFNLNPSRTQAIFDYLIQNYRTHLSCQFEIYADLLSSELITHLNNELHPHFFRFEVGIQSTYEKTNAAVDRKQNTQLLMARLKEIMQGGKIDLHLDLLAGLPFETYALFIQSFNEVLSLRAKEVQLGFLKMLRGTKIRNEASLHGYRFDEKAPYEIRENNYINEEELNQIHRAENMLDIYWNSGRFLQSMKTIFDLHYKGLYFQFFLELADFYQSKQHPLRQYQLEDLFRNLHHFLMSKKIDIREKLLFDYYRCFKQRPNGTWLPSMDKKQKKGLIERLHRDRPFLKRTGLTPYQIENQTCFYFVDETTLILTHFDGCTYEHPQYIYPLEEKTEK